MQNIQNMIAPLVILQDTWCLHLSVLDILIKCIHFKEKSCSESSSFFLFYVSFPLTFEIYMSFDHPSSLPCMGEVLAQILLWELCISAVFNRIKLLKNKSYTHIKI